MLAEPSLLKYVIVVRHAKSSWKNMKLKDHDRPLNKRGLKNGPDMANYVQSRVDTPSMLMTSSAVRAKETALYFKEATGVSDQNFMVNSALYHASSHDILNIIANQSADLSSIMLFAHNPGVTDFVNAVTDSEIDNIPTCGVAVIAFNMAKWSEIKQVKGKLEDYYYPKGI
ncbi:MAG: histidine phosphatase family protein [Reichenbachiella sp.]